MVTIIKDKATKALSVGITTKIKVPNLVVLNVENKDTSLRIVLKIEIQIRNKIGIINSTKAKKVKKIII